MSDAEDDISDESHDSVETRRASPNDLRDIRIIPSAWGRRMECPECGRLLPPDDYTECDRCGAHFELKAVVVVPGQDR